jgi:hypothetical protein
MKTLNGGALFVLLSLLPACEQQLVEFPNGGTPDAAILEDGGNLDGGPDGGNLGDGGDGGVNVLAPVVIFTDPENGATNIARSATVNATFSEAMDPASMDGQTFTLMQGATAVAGAVTYAGVTITLTPTGNLPANATFTARISTRAKSIGGAALAVDYTWSFTTIAANAPVPIVVSTDPPSGATGVVLNQRVSATFNEAMNPSTLNTTTFTLKQGTAG